MTSVDPSLLVELSLIRDFLASTVEQAIMSLNLTSGIRVLDVGTGAGGALPPLVRTIGTTGSVLAVDKDPAILALASDHADQAGITDRVTFRLGDITEVLTDAAAAPEMAFDAVWAGDVIYPVYFEEPASIVRQMARALRPGGIIALFYPNYYRATYLPGHSLLERRLCTAWELCAGAPVEGPHHREQHLTWLLAAGLDDVNLKVFPRVCFPVDTDPTVRPYLEHDWPGARKIAATHGAEAGLSIAEVDELQRLLTPGDPNYVMDEPGYFAMFPTILVTGRKPTEAPQ